MNDSKHTCVVIIRTGQQERAHIVVRSSFIIGRSLDSDLPFPEPTVSRQHLKVQVEPGLILITDLGSNNGTFINGQPLTAHQQTPISPTTEIVLGTSENRLSLLSIPTPVELMDSSDMKKVLASGLNDIQTEREQIRQNVIAEERQRITSVLQQEELQMRKQVTTQIETVRKSADAKIRQDLSEARLQAEQILIQATQNAENLKFQMLDQTKSQKQALEAEIESLQIEAKTVAEQIETEARKEADRIVRNAEQLATSQIQAAAQKADALAREMSERSREKLAAAEKQSQELLHKARNEAANVLKDAQERCQVQIVQAEKRSTHLLQQARTEAEAQVENIRRQAIDSARSEAHSEQERIIREHRSILDKLTSERNLAQNRIQSIQTEVEHLEARQKSLRSEIQESELYLDQKRLSLTQLSEAVSAAQSTIAAAQAAQQELETTEAAVAAAESRLTDLHSQFGREQKVLQDQFEQNKQDYILKASELKKKIDHEVAEEKLQALSRLKQLIDEEEEKYRRTLKTKSLEIASRIEKPLIAFLSDRWPSGAALPPTTELMETLRTATEEVIVGQGLQTQAVTTHLESERRAIRFQKHKKIAAITAATALVVMLFFSTTLFNYLKANLANLGDDNQYIKRNVENIYVPVQTEEWHDSYTENVIYLRDYLESKTDTLYQEQWALQLSNLELLRSLNLSEDDMIQFIGKESALVLQLANLRKELDAKFLDFGIKKMKETESQTLAEIQSILKGEATLSKIRRIEREFTQKFMAVRAESKSLRKPTGQPNSR